MESVEQKRNIISTLWNDKEKRAVIIQIFSIAGLFALVWFMIGNAISNLDALGKGFSFDFLFQPASYDINQHLISYTSRDTHLRATIIGIMNTAMIAVAGIILATVVGFTLSVLRLSKNFLINRIVYIYIEYIRNVPVLLHILLVHGVVVHSLPNPKAAMTFNDSFFLTKRGFFMPSPDFESAMTVVWIALAIGIAFTFWFRRYAKRVQDETGKIFPVFLISFGAVVIFPVLVYFLAGSPITWEIPVLKGFNFKGGMVVRPEFLALWLALSLYTAAFIAEIVRAGIIAVSHGQTEAAYALGLRAGRTTQLIVIPQALRVIVPPLTSQYLNLTKNSSLAIAIGYMDIVATIGGISLNQTGREMECMIIVLTLYLIFSLSISSVMNWYNKRIKLVER